MLGRLGAAGPVRRLLDSATNAAVSDGRLLYVRDGALVAQRLRPEAPRPLGRAEGARRRPPLQSAIRLRGLLGERGAASSPSSPGKQRDLSRLVWRDRSGRRLGELGTPGNLSGFGGLALSRDGRRAAVSRVDDAQGDADIWLYDVDRGTETRLARQGADESDPLFSPDGSTLYFGSAGDDGSALVRRDLASGPETTLFASKTSYSLGPHVASPRTGPSSPAKTGAAWPTPTSLLRPVDGKGEARVLVRTPGDDAYGQISPDGRWLLWASDESGRYEVYVAPFPGGGAGSRSRATAATSPGGTPAEASSSSRRPTTS